MNDNNIKRPILLMDIDGVLNPAPFDMNLSTDWFFEPSFRSDKASGEFILNLSREMGKAIMSLNAEIFWLSTWIKDIDSANPNIGKHMGWPNLPILPTINRNLNGGSFKREAVKEFIKDPGPEVFWIDDDAEFIWKKDRPDCIDLHNRLNIVSPNSMVGLSWSEFFKIKEKIKKLERE